MKRIVEFPLEDGTSILVEVDEPETGGLVQAARNGDVIEQAHQTLEKSMEKVRPAAEFILKQLKKYMILPMKSALNLGSS